MQLGIQTKNGRFFTRFSIRGILQNPVLPTADLEAYEYFEQSGSQNLLEKKRPLTAPME